MPETVRGSRPSHSARTRAIGWAAFEYLQMEGMWLQTFDRIYLFSRVLPVSFDQSGIGCDDFELFGA